MTRSDRRDVHDACASQVGIEDGPAMAESAPEGPEPRKDSRTAAAAEGSFDHYARLVQRLLRVPTALVTILEEHRQVFPGAVGLAEPIRIARQTPLSHSFCKYVAEDGALVIITDARKVERARPTIRPSQSWT